jgi:hypothetical protein
MWTLFLSYGFANKSYFLGTSMLLGKASDWESIMIKSIRHPNKRDLFIVGTAAALALAPRAAAAEETHATTEVEALRAENAQLHDQLARISQTV